MKALICDAITRRRCISFIYLDRQRMIEPHLCGRNQAGHDLVLGYLVAGHSSSDPKPGWRNYLLSELRQVEVTEDGFERPRPRFNPHDRRFIEVYCQVTTVRPSGP